MRQEPTQTTATPTHRKGKALYSVSETCSCGGSVELTANDMRTLGMARNRHEAWLNDHAACQEARKNSAINLATYVPDTVSQAMHLFAEQITQHANNEMTQIMANLLKDPKIVEIIKTNTLPWMRATVTAEVGKVLRNVLTPTGQRPQDGELGVLENLEAQAQPGLTMGAHLTGTYDETQWRAIFAKMADEAEAEARAQAELAAKASTKPQHSAKPQHVLESEKKKRWRLK